MLDGSDLHAFPLHARAFKLLGPFAQETEELSPAALRGIAVRAFVVGLTTANVGGYLGTVLVV
jgi:hypothetical protein